MNWLVRRVGFDKFTDLLLELSFFLVHVDTFRRLAHLTYSTARNSVSRYRSTRRTRVVRLASRVHLILLEYR